MLATEKIWIIEPNQKLSSFPWISLECTWPGCWRKIAYLSSDPKSMSWGAAPAPPTLHLLALAPTLLPARKFRVTLQNSLVWALLALAASTTTQNFFCPLWWLLPDSGTSSAVPKLHFLFFLQLITPALGCGVIPEGLGIPLYRVSHISHFPWRWTGPALVRENQYQTGHITFPKSVEKFPEDLLEFKLSS